MAFTTIPTSIIESGDPVTTTLMSTYLKDNLDDHEARLVDLEAGSAQNFMPLNFPIDGPLTATTQRIELKRVPFNITLLAGRLIVGEAGTGGTTTIDIQYYRSGSWASVFSTKPSVTSTTDYTASTNGVLSVTSILSGDLLALRVDTIQTGTGNDAPRGLLAVLEFEKT